MKKTSKLIFGAIAAMLLVALLVWAFAPRPVPVELATATLGRFEMSVDEDAKTRVRDRYIVSAPLAGLLARIELREGDAVAADAVVAKLAPVLPPMLDARTLQELSARVETADAMVARANTRIASAAVGLELARNQLKRSEQLARDGYVSATQLENERLALRAAQKEQDSAREDRHVATHELEQARAALQVVRASSRRAAGSATVDKRSGGVDAADFEVHSPIAGSVLRVLQASETTLSLGTPLLEIGDVRNMEVVAELLTTDALQAVPGTDVRIERWGGPGPLQGRVRRVEPAAFTKVSALGVEEQRVNVLIDITSPPEQWQALGDGYRVSVRIIVIAHDGVLRVPVSAVFPHSDGQNSEAMAAFAVVAGRARLVPVAVGARNGVDAWIKSGLKPGDQVIVYPSSLVRDGVRVSVRTVSGHP